MSERYPQRQIGDRPEVRYSRLKNMALSPAHYLDRLTAPEKRKKTFDLGTATHALVLGGRAVIGFSGGDRRLKDWKAFEAEHKESGALLLTQPEMDLAMAAAQSVKGNKLAMQMLEGHRERELKPWAMAGRQCGGRPDVLNDREHFVAELKTSRTSEPWRFTRYGLSLGYPGQVDWYATGARTNGTEIRQCYVVAVEMAPPFVVTPMRFTERALLLGHKCWIAWFEQLLVCESSDHWPGYVQHVADFDVPDTEDVDLTYADDEEGEAA